MVKLNHARLYVESRLYAEDAIVFCRCAERFRDRRRIREDLLTANGLTPKGVEVLMVDFLDIINEANVHLFVALVIKTFTK